MTGAPGDDPRVLAERVRMLYDRAATAQVTVVVNALLVAWVYRGLASPVVSLAWVATLAALAALRMVLVRAYRRGGVAAQDAARTWAHRFTAGAALTGVCWGAAALVFHAPQSAPHQLFLAFVLGGMAAGASSSNASYTPAFLAFTAPALLPMVVRLASQHDRVHVAMAFMLALFGVAMAAISRSGGRAVTDALILRFRNEALVDGLTATRGRLETLNATLERRVGERTAELERMLALRIASEARLAVTLRSIGDAVIATGGDGEVTLFNGVAEALTGWTAEEARGRPLEEVFRTREDGNLQPVQDLVGRALRAGVALGPDNCNLLRRNGMELPIAVTAAPIRDSGGGVLGVVLVFRDRTQERRAVYALRQSEQRLRELADSMHPLAWTARPDGYVTWYNGRWYEYTGTTPEQVEGWGWQAVHDRAALPEVLRRWNDSIARGTTFEMELRLRGANGAFRHFLTRVFPLKDPAGAVTQWFGTHTDVTELIEARELLRQSDAQKNQFIALLSHELRNPLAAIRSSLYLLEHSHQESPTFSRGLEIIRRQTDHLARLVDDLLDVGRISRGKVELRRQRVDATEVVRRVCEDYRAVLAGRGVELRPELPAAAWIDADATRIAQVVGNLLHNAAKFSHEGGAVVVRVGAAGGRVEIRVRDEGVGIPPDLLPRLFEPFVRADTGLARTNAGLGLGLALSKGLVELHGGSVRAHSEGRERGAEFVLSFPAVAAPERPEPAASLAPAAAAVARASLNVLVIEDNADTARSLAEVLALEGHRVHVATDARSGIARARELRPEVILCDIGLPDADGYEVARTLRADDALRATRLVALSGYAQPEDRGRAAEAGFDEHLSKPVPIDVVLASLRPRRGGS